VLWDVQPLPGDPAKSLPAGDEELEALREDSEALWFNAGPGRYAVRVAVKEPKQKQQVARVVVAVAPRKPTPTPPGPDPVPTPNKAAKLWIVVVEETAERHRLDQGRQRVLADARLWKGLADQGHRFALLDKDLPAADQPGQLDPAVASYLRHATAQRPLPLVLLFDQAAATPAQPLRVERLPASPTALQALVKEHTLP
jgi:hypothetical protein